MKTVAIIQARMSSTRLPDKVLMPVLGKPLLGWMLDRVASCSEIDEIIVATTKNKRDDAIEEFTKLLNCRLYRGNEEDVLDRYYQAACSVKCDTVVRITADCPLLDPKILSTMIRQFSSEDLDFLSNSEPLPSSWPDGMDVSIVSFNALHKAWKNSIKPSEREHVTFHFWNNLTSFKCKRIEHEPDWSKYRLTIDYPEDFEILKIIIEYFGANNPEAINKISMEEIVSFLDTNPAILDLNKTYTRGLGWQPALKLDKQHGF